MRTKDKMTISELSRLAGVPASTIRFYLREGLIIPPIKKGKTRAYYSKEHITQLKKLKQLRVKKRLSIEEIKNAQEISRPMEAYSAQERSKQSDRKDDIINAAIELFRSKGYDATSINDIAVLASISKRTFYKHFSDKETLFYECADSVFENIDIEYRETLKETDIINRLFLRASIFFKKHRHMIDMLNVARVTSGTMDPQSRKKLMQIMANLIAPLSGDLEEGIRQGIFRKVNAHAVAHMLMGMAEYGVYFCEGKRDEEIDQFVKNSITLIFQGFIKNKIGSR